MAPCACRVSSKAPRARSGNTKLNAFENKSNVLNNRQITLAIVYLCVEKIVCELGVGVFLSYHVRRNDGEYGIESHVNKRELSYRLEVYNG